MNFGFSPILSMYNGFEPSKHVHFTIFNFFFVIGNNLIFKD